MYEQINHMMVCPYNHHNDHGTNDGYANELNEGNLDNSSNKHLDRTPSCHQLLHCSNNEISDCILTFIV